MIQRCFILFLCVLVMSCSDNTRSIQGYWINPQGKAIAEFKDKSVTLTLLDKRGIQLSSEYEKLNESTYMLTGGLLGISSELIVDWENNSFEIRDFFGERKAIVFTRPPDIKPSHIAGTWYFYKKDNLRETSVIIQRRDSSYDYNSLEIYHANKFYIQETFSKVKSDLKAGFIFNDQKSKTGQNHSYYLLSYDKDRMTFVDLKGRQWTQQRKNNAKQITIPKGYRKEEVIYQ